MRIWLITVGEPLPIDGAHERLLRTGIIAEQLADAGEEVVWWSSTFDHSRKVQRGGERSRRVSPKCEIRLLAGMSYKSNTSIRRILNHRSIAREFFRLAPSLVRPDVILCSFPTIELSRAAVEYGRRHEVPVYLDVRDLWPDIFLDVAPAKLRPLARRLLSGQFRDAGYALRHCDGIFAVSESYLQWALAKAGRTAGPCDAVFPLAYEARSEPASDPEEWLRAHCIDPGKTIIWFVGAFGRTYDLATVIRAAERLNHQGRADLQFVLSGDGPFSGEWREQGQGLPNVTFTGWIDGQGIAALMRASDIGLMAYAKGAPQGLPNKLFEYLSAGLPVLSSLGAETRDVIVGERCGVVYEAESEDSLLRAIQKLDDPRVRREMGTRGRKLFERQYAARPVYGALIERLRDAAMTRRRRHDVAPKNQQGSVGRDG